MDRLLFAIAIAIAIAITPVSGIVRILLSEGISPQVSVHIRHLIHCINGRRHRAGISEIRAVFRIYAIAKALAPPIKKIRELRHSLRTPLGLISRK